MQSTVAAPGARPRPWFETWFDTPDYHRLYAGHDEAEAESFVAALVARLEPAPGAQVLDLGCGAGRHSRRLAARGLRVTGLDLAASSLREARRRPMPGLSYRRADMRRPFGSERYDHVFSFFTSFGYFSDCEHERILAHMARALRPGGTLLIDYLNAAPAQRRLVAAEERLVDGVRYRLERWTDRRHFHKRIVVDDGSAGGVQHVERVAKLDLADFETLLAGAGLRLEDVYGGHALGAYDPEVSPRMILLARKPEPAAAQRLAA